MPKAKTPQEYFSRQERLSLVKLPLPESLNDYFKDFIPDMGNVLRFMRKYLGDDPYVKKVIEVYDLLPPFRKKDRDLVDLDYLAEKADVEKIILRERILIAISRYNDGVWNLAMATYGAEVVKEIIGIALNSAHPDSQKCKELVAQKIGFMAVPKSAQINITNTQISNEQKLSVELPPMHETLNPIETILKAYQEQKQLEESKFIDLDEKEDEKAIIELVEGEDYTDEEDDEE